MAAAACQSNLEVAELVVAILGGCSAVECIHRGNRCPICRAVTVEVFVQCHGYSVGSRVAIGWVEAGVRVRWAFAPYGVANATNFVDAHVFVWVIGRKADALNLGGERVYVAVGGFCAATHFLRADVPACWNVAEFNAVVASG